jgi:hypothetical protein
MRMTDERELGFRHQTMRAADRILCHATQLLAGQQRSENQLGTSSGKGAMAEMIKAGGPPRKTVTGKF